MTAGDASFDVLVVGGGHAGAEAALAAARLGVRTAMAVLDPAAIGRMSCNPAIGGIGKGQLVREIDALGGEMGLVTDAAGIQFRMLNTSKGPAVRSPRAQCDRALYNREMVGRVLGQAGLTVIAGEVVDLLADGAPGSATVTGVRLADGREIATRAVVLTTGTFLAGKLFAGEWTGAGGRIGEAPASRLSASLRALGIALGRHKTGTPPRLRRASIDISRLEPQHGDDPPRPFSFRTARLDVAQEPCWLTRTNPATHEAIRRHADRSPLFSGRIVGTGPRYCPSVEDKVVRFPDQTAHLIFLEPEGRDSDEVYPNGISTSLPAEVQEEFVRTIAGLEDAVIVRPGYAVEYDYVRTDQIRADLSVAGVARLWSAGQINGTSGYEEAAGQGFVAGVNAARAIRGRSPLALDRAGSYLGVMIDDLCRVNPTEPYRMFTSRAEFRLMLRSDNADRRLASLAREIGILGPRDSERVAAKENRIAAALASLAAQRSDGQTLQERLRRPEVDASDPRIATALAVFALAPDERSEVEAEVKYEGYVARQAREVDRIRRLEGCAIPEDADYASVRGLSREARERLVQRRPRTIGEASRLPGVTPADVQLVLAVLGR
ncbi:MAG: tRNA uridine-5-carboxymethylaminomethyl(34) synthesis enzyme MnmG [Planctomycetes bacterium]|nr:tRNA uridine-5-carboxymethylaminomethyl(34) synthesis enzyme MnmG [Planctomycetota bacterium]